MSAASTPKLLFHFAKQNTARFLCLPDYEPRFAISVLANLIAAVPTKAKGDAWMDGWIDAAPMCGEITPKILMLCGPARAHEMSK